MSRSASGRRHTRSPAQAGKRGRAGMSTRHRSLSRAMEEIPYTVRRSDRARRVRVTVDAARGVEVVLPRRAPERAAATAMQELRPWVERRLAEVHAARDAVHSRAGRSPYLGRLLTLAPEPGRRRVHRRDEVLLVPAGPDQREALERWYRREAHAVIAPRLDAASAAVGRPYTRLTIRSQRTRWASCSREGAMSFNWRLLLAPETVLDYVVWHEACHLRVMDHSPRFWSLVGGFWPEYRRDATWLRRHGSTLVL
jgi:predicted metal-dependent hydrolase